MTPEEEQDAKRQREKQRYASMTDAQKAARVDALRKRRHEARECQNHEPSTSHANSTTLSSVCLSDESNSSLSMSQPQPPTKQPRKSRSEMTEEERERVRQNDRERYARMTPEQKKARLEAARRRRSDPEEIISIDTDTATVNTATPQLNRTNRKARDSNIKPVECYLGKMDNECQHCHALHFNGERNWLKQFGDCCKSGKIFPRPLHPYPEPLNSLLNFCEDNAVHFRSNIRSYNSALAFASLSYTHPKDKNIPGAGPKTFVIHGQLYHLTSTAATSNSSSPPTYSQLYFLDPEFATEERLKNSHNTKCKRIIMENIDALLRQINPYAQAFKMMKEVQTTTQCQDIRMLIVKDQFQDPRRYNLPTANEVAAVFTSEDGGQHLTEIFANLRVESYLGLMDFVNTQAEQQNLKAGKIFILPSSFGGGKRALQQNYQDAMTLVAVHGKPDLFITFTCNPKWKEITENLRPGESALDRPDLVATVFHLKMKEFMNDMLNNHILGKVKCYLLVIEFQKRGLPHCHMLFMLNDEDKLREIEDVDSVVCAEIPNELMDPELYNIVTTSMIHGPCGQYNINAPCMDEVEGKKICTKNFPKDYCDITVLHCDGYPKYRRRKEGATINKKGVELDNSWVVPYNPYLSRKYNAHINIEVCSSVKSIKYIFKYIYKGHDAAVIKVSETGEGTYNWDEITTYLIQDTSELQSNVETSGEGVYRPRKTGFEKVLPRMYAVSPRDTERFCLRLLLLHIRGATSYEDLRTVDGVCYETFKEAAIAKNLLDGDENWIKTLEEASLFQMPSQLRMLLCSIFVFGFPTNPMELYMRFKEFLSEDYTHLYDTDTADQLTLRDIDENLSQFNTCCRDFGLPSPRFVDIDNSSIDELIVNERESGRLLALLNEEQRLGVRKDISVLGFDYNSAFAWGIKVKSVAPTGLAATLLKNGQTVHSGFRLPLKIDETSVSRLTQSSPEFHVLKQTKLIIWDEISMCTAKMLDCVDRSLRDLLNCQHKPFGGISVVVGGDFRQQAPVILQGLDEEHKKSDFLKLSEEILSGNIVKTVFGTNINGLALNELASRAILCPRNDDTLRINETILSQLNGSTKTYYSVDTVTNCETEEERQLYPVEFLNSLTPMGMPPHQLNLKIGSCVMLLRNMNPKRGLCNGTRLVVERLGSNIIDCVIFSGDQKGSRVFIPRMCLDADDSDLPFQLRRKQFPLRLAYSMTITKSQGQTFDKIGVYLHKPVFSHGQLYTALSRVKSKTGLALQIFDGRSQGKIYENNNSTYTYNCVYSELL
ncbi:ATP-dependent DNA helicase pif1 [Orchesella cincta]|uniref:ATP-dependent DNA helicase n=1 Tax=Orchesella cincta TaxID=48709 RepID=A0A1D2M1S3_ORCCI|nr:ATP-dependent DNA helicase pif1 [Orchesella cincta]